MTWHVAIETNARFSLSIVTRTKQLPGVVRARRNGIEGECTIILHTESRLVLKIDGGNYWSGRGQRGYASPSIIVAVRGAVQKDDPEKNADVLATDPTYGWWYEVAEWEVGRKKDGQAATVLRSR